MGGGRILLVDDDATFRTTTAKLLSLRGYRCWVAADAAGAAGALVRERFDALVTDIRMPDAWDLTHLQVHDDAGRLPPTIVVTAYPGVSTAIEAVRLSVVDYLCKPFEIEDLVRAVGRAVERARLARRRIEARARAEDLVEALRTLEGDPGRPAGWSTEDEGLGPDLSSLSDREREVVHALQRGLRVAEIAGQLHLSPHTVRNHVKRVFRKLGVHSQIELLAELR